MTQEYHVLVVGFELEKRSRDGADSRVTNLRHYRYDMADFNISNENGAWIVKRGKNFVASFPVSKTMIHVEEVEDKQ